MKIIFITLSLACLSWLTVLVFEALTNLAMNEEEWRRFDEEL